MFATSSTAKWEASHKPRAIRRTTFRFHLSTVFPVAIVVTCVHSPYSFIQYSACLWVLFLSYIWNWLFCPVQSISPVHCAWPRSILFKFYKLYEKGFHQLMSIRLVFQVYQRFEIDSQVQLRHLRGGMALDLVCMVIILGISLLMMRLLRQKMWLVSS